MSDAILGLVVLGSIRKQDERLKEAEEDYTVGGATKWEEVQEGNL